MRNKLRHDPKADIKEIDANSIIESGEKLVGEIEAKLSLKVEENERN